MKKIILLSAFGLMLGGCSPQTITQENNSTIKQSNSISIEQLSNEATEQINPPTPEQESFNDKTIKQYSNVAIQQKNNPIIEQTDVSPNNVTIEAYNNENSAREATTIQAITEVPQEITTLLKVNDTPYSFPFSENTTVLEFMQNLHTQSAQQFYFETKNYAGIGKFVTSINGLKENPQDKMYWIYYINDKPAQMGISDYIITQGDIIEWNYEKAKF